MTNLPEERLAAAWTAIEAAVTKGLAPASAEADPEGLAAIVPVTSGSSDLATYMRYTTPEHRPATNPYDATPSELKVDAHLDDVFELVWTTPLDREKGFSDSGEPLKACKLTDWGKAIRRAECRWVLERLFNGCVSQGELTPEDHIFEKDRDLRVIPFHGFENAVKDLPNWPIRATVKVTAGMPLPAGVSGGWAALVIPVTGGPNVTRIEDVELTHTVNSETVMVYARARYQLSDFGSSREPTAGNRYRSIGKGPASSAK